jgi:hypothetical protein
VVWGWIGGRGGGRTPHLIFLFVLRVHPHFSGENEQPLLQQLTDDIQHRHLHTNLATEHRKCVLRGVNSPSTSLAFHILLALTNARIRVTSRLISPAPRRITTARLATLAAEVIVIIFTTVTLLPSHSRFALTLAFAVTLQTS